MTSSATDKRYGRQGGRWASGVTSGDVIAELDVFRANKAAELEAEQLRRSVAGEQLELFAEPIPPPDRPR